MAIRVSIQDNFDVELTHAIRRAPQVLEYAKVRVSQYSMKAIQQVKTRMPVDTGRARASWGNDPAGAPAEPGDGVFAVSDQGLTITQGTNVEYVQYLNEGHSSQAPAGFIDAVAEEVGEDFENALMGDLMRLFS